MWETTLCNKPNIYCTQGCSVLCHAFDSDSGSPSSVPCYNTLADVYKFLRTPPTPVPLDLILEKSLKLSKHLPKIHIFLSFSMITVVRYGHLFPVVRTSGFLTKAAKRPF